MAARLHKISREVDQHECAPSKRNNQYSQLYVGLGGPFTTNISTTKYTLYTICFCPNRSVLLGSLVATSVCPWLGVPTRLDTSAGSAVASKLLMKAGCTYSDVDLMEGPDLPSAGSEERLGCAVFLYGSKTIINSIPTKTKVKQKQSLSRPTRKELKPRPSNVKNVSQPFSSCGLWSCHKESLWHLAIMFERLTDPAVCTCKQLPYDYICYRLTNWIKYQTSKWKHFITLNYCYSLVNCKCHKAVLPWHLPHHLQWC